MAYGYYKKGRKSSAYSRGFRAGMRKARRIGRGRSYSKKRRYY